MSEISKRKNKFDYPPIKYINEEIPEHFTQIIYMLKESFIDKDKGFIGWEEFTKEQLIKICNKDKHIYIENYYNGLEFVKEFPKVIDSFLENYCIQI